MRAQRFQDDETIVFNLFDEVDQPIAEVGGFIRHLGARRCSPNTLCAYAHDLCHFWQFLELASLTVDGFGPAESLTLLDQSGECPVAGRPGG